LEGGCDRTLLDERELKYNLSITDTFELAKFYSEQIYKLLPQIIQTAIVCDEEFIKDAAFWEDCAVNRGLYVKVFTSLEMAKRWLDDGG
jgi:hypothetical protein